MVVLRPNELAQLPKPPRGMAPVEMIGLLSVVAVTFLAAAVIPAGAWVGGAIMGAGWRRRITKETEAYEREAVDARATLQRGQLAEAQAVFWKWAEQAGTATVGALARIDLGMTLVQRGEHARAIAVLEPIVKNYRVEIERNGKTSQTAVWIALAHALQGNAEAARTWLGSRGKGHDEFATYVEAVVRCRLDESAEAAKLLDERWIEVEAGMTGRHLRAVRIVRALAHSAAGPRATGTAASVLLGIRPSYPGEFAFLGAAWPEMAAFLATHELAG